MRRLRPMRMRLPKAGSAAARRDCLAAKRWEAVSRTRCAAITTVRRKAASAISSATPANATASTALCVGTHAGRFAGVGRRLVGNRQRVQGVRQFAAEGCPEHAARRVDAGAVRSERERGGGERGVDADDPSAGVQKRAAAVAGIDVRAVLHDAHPSQPPGAFDDAPDAAFVVARCDGCGHGVGSAGKAHRQHVEQRGWRHDGQRQWAQGAEPVIANAQHGEVQAFRGPHRLCQRGAVAVPRHDAPAASHDVVVRCDVPLRVQHEAGAVTVFHHQQHHGCGGSIAHGGIVEHGCSRRVLTEGCEDSDQRQRERTGERHAVSDGAGRGLWLSKTLDGRWRTASTA